MKSLEMKNGEKHTMKCSFSTERLSHKATAFLTAVFFIFSGISAPISFAETASLTRDDRQQLVPVVSYDPLASATPADTAPVPEIPSGVAIRNTNPLSAASSSVNSTGTFQSSSSQPVSVIANGDFLQKTSGNTLPDGWEPFWTTTQSVPGYLSSYDGKTGVVDLSLSRAGRGMKQSYGMPITLDRFSRFDITFKIVTATLAGDGSYGIEAPVIFRANVLRTDGSAYQVTKYFNYTGDANSGSNPNFVLVPQDQWVTRSFTSQALGLAAGDQLTEIDVLSGGWDRTSYVDSVNVYLDQVPPVTISLNGVESELPFGTDMTVAAVTDIAVDAYSWYLDGTLIPGATTSNVTTGKLLTTGGHTLIVETTLGGVVTSLAAQFQIIDFSQYAQLDVSDQYAPVKTVHWAQDISTFTHSYWDPSSGTAIIQYYPITSSVYAYGDSLQLDRSYTAWSPPGQTQGHTYEDRALVEFDLSRWYQLGFDPNRVQRVELLATVSGSGETFQGYDFSIGSMQALEDGLFSSAQDDFNVSTISLQTFRNLQLNSTPLDLRFNVTGLLLNELALRDAWSGIVFKSDAANLPLMQLANIRLRVYYDADSDSIPPSQPVVTSTVPAATNQTVVTLSGTKEANTSIWINDAQVVALNDSTAWTATVNLPAEGNNQINLVAKDQIGLVSTVKTCAILRDTVVPTGSININASALYATSQKVTLNLFGADNSSGISAMSFSTDNANWTASEAYAVSKAFTLPAGDGTKTVHVKYFDKAGNASPVYSKNIILDATMPSGSIGINSGAPYATSTSVTLNLSGVDTGSGITTMSFSSDGATWSAAETYAATKTYALSSGDGTKTVYVRFYDKAGNMSQFSDSIVLDTLVPTGTVKVNGGVSYINQATVMLNLSAADTGSGVSAMSFSTNGTTWGAAEAYVTAKAWIFASGDGAKSIYVKFLDNSGKWSAVMSVTVTLDTVKPSGSININSSALYATSQTVTLNLSGTDASSGISTMSFSTDNTNWTTPVAYVTSKTFTLPAGDGTKTVYVKYFDKAGNASLIYSKSIYFDVSQPTGTITINSGATYATSAAVTLNLSGADSGSGIAKMSFSTNGTTWTAAEAYAGSKAFTLPTGDGAKTVYVKYYDKAGNVSQVFSKSIILDTLAPVGTVKVNGGVAFINQTAVQLNLSATDATSGMNMMSFSANNTTWTTAEAYATTKAWTFPAGDGAKTVYVKFQDKAGRWSTAVSVSVTMDTVKPTGTININSSALYASSQVVILNLSGTDASSGISTMSFSTDNANWTTPVAYATSKTFTLPAGDGTKTVYVKYYDKVGNASLVYSKSILLDMTQPAGTITINSGAVYATSTAVTLNLSGADSGSGIAKMSFSTNGTTWTAAEAYAASKAFTLPTGDGAKTVYVKYYDKAGNVSQVFSKSIILDTLAPVGTVKVNGGLLYINQTAATLNLSATDAGSGLQSMSFSTNGTIWTTAEAYATTKAWTFPTGDGAKTVYVKFQDKAGRWSAAVSVAVTMDTVKPTGTININSSALYAASQTVTLNLSGTDASSGISTMSFSTDNTNWTTPVAYATSKTFTLPAGDGTKTVYVKYYDKVGNASLVYSKTIILDMLAPTGTVTVSGGAQYISQAGVMLNLSAADAGSGLSKMSFSTNGTTWTTAENYATIKAWTFITGDGTKTVYVKYQDKSGKWSAIGSVTVTLDTVKPTGSININNGAASTNSETVTLNLTGYDAGSGVDQMRFSTDSGATWSSWEAFSASKSFTLPVENGPRQVQCQLRDKAGLISTIFSDTIVVDIQISSGWIPATSNANYSFRVTQNQTGYVMELFSKQTGQATLLFSGTGNIPDNFDVTADGRMVIYEGDGNAYVQVIGNPGAKATVQGDLKSIQYYGYYVMLKTEMQYPSGTVFQRATGITINTPTPGYVSSFFTTLITAGTGFYRNDTLGIAVQVEYYASTGQYQATIYNRYGGNDYSCSTLTVDLDHETGTSGGTVSLIDAVAVPNGEAVITIGLDSPTFNRTYLFRHNIMPNFNAFDGVFDGAATAVTYQGRYAIYNVRDNDGLTRTLWVDLETLEVIPDLPSVELVPPVITQTPALVNQWTLKLDQAMRGVRYEIQFTTDLAPNAWQTAGSFIADRYGEVSWQDRAQERGTPVSYRVIAKEITTATDLLTQVNLLYFDSEFGLVESTHEYPLEGWLQRGITQPSNFGFYANLLATIAAGDLVTSTISKTEAIRRLDVLTTHLLEDQKTLGHKGLFPWLGFTGSDWARMDDVYGRQVSFEDNTNFTNALAVAYGALLDDSLAGDTTVHGSGGILGKIDSFIANQKDGYLAMYNTETNTFSQTMQISDDSLSGAIALFGAESSAPLLFLTLQYGDTFPASAYAKLNFGTRSYTMQDLTVKDVVAPFSGAFQIYWPALLMPESENPDLRSMLESYTDVQLDFAERNGQPGLLSAGYDVWTDNLLNRCVSAFSWAGDNVTGVREGDDFHVKSELTNAGIGVVFNDGTNKFAFEGSTMQLHYSSKTAVPNARIEFKKKIGGVLQTVYTEALSLENTGGVERTVSFTLPLNGVLGELTEIVFATSGGGPLDVTFHSFDADRIGYNFPLGINEIALGPTVETTPSVYNLGAAHMFRSAQVEVLLQGLIADHRDLISNHGLWEGKNMASGKVVNEQVFNNVVTFTLGMVGMGPSYMTRYLENKGLTSELESIWDPQTPVSVTGRSTAYNFSYSDAIAVYNATSWKLNESVMASGREIRITYQSDTPISGARFELKHSLDNNVPAYSQSFDLPATGGVPGEFILKIPANFLYWGISEMVVIYPEAKGFPSASITGMTVAPAGVVVPPGVVLDPRTPHLIKTKTLTVSYTVDGVAKTKLFENLQEGVNTLTITEGETVVRWDVTVDTVPPAVVLDPGTPALINTTSLTIYYKVDGVAKQKTFSGLGQGTNLLTITETDLAGNPTVVNWTVRLDTTGLDLLSGQLAIFSFDGGNVNSSWESDHLHLTSTNLQGLGVSSITPVPEVTGHQLQIRYSSVTSCGAVKVEFKKRINGVLKVMGALYFSLENTGGIVRTLTMGPIPPGMPTNLDEITFVSQGGGSSLDMSLYGLVLFEPVQA